MDDSYLHPANRQDAEQCGQRQHPLHPLLPLPGPPTIPRFSPRECPLRRYLANTPRQDPLPLRPYRLSSRERGVRDVASLIRRRARAKRDGWTLGRYLTYMQFRCAVARALHPSLIPPRAQRTTAARRRWVGRSLAHRESKMAARASAGTPSASAAQPANRGADARSPARPHARHGQSIIWRERRGFKRRGAPRAARGRATFAIRLDN